MMRPGQQNNNNNKNRQRGRNNNNNGGRKHMNPLSRNYESNGPDVKVRGNAAHVAEKYVQLARDAHSSGDSVMAENYLQHAEHYFRILSAAQPQPQRPDQVGQETETEDTDNEDFGADEQSRFDTPTYRANLQNDRQYQDGPPQQQNGGQFNRNGDGQQGDRQPRFDQQQPRNDQPRNDQPRNDQPRFEQPPRVEPVGAETGESTETLAADDASMAAAPVQNNEQGGEPRRRERRPRRRRPQMAEGDSIDPNGPQPDVGELPAFITAGGPTTAGE